MSTDLEYCFPFTNTIVVLGRFLGSFVYLVKFKYRSDQGAKGTKFLQELHTSKKANK